MQIAIDPKIVQDFLFKVEVYFHPTPTTKKIIEEFVGVDVTAEMVAKIIQRNQYIENLLYTEVKSLGMKGNIPSLQALVALMGMQNVRNFILVQQLYRTVTKKHPSVGKDGKFAIKAVDHLKYALRAEEFASGTKLVGAETAYAAGYLFDLLRYIAKEHFAQAKPFDEYMDQIFKHSMRTAIVGANIAKGMKNFVYLKQVFSACMILDIGKLVLEMIHPQGTPNAYSKFREDIAKKPMSRFVTHFVEMKRYGVPHEFFSAQLAYAFPLFRTTERAILFHHHPFLLKSSAKDMHQLASLLALASNVAGNFRTPKDTADPIFNSWLTPEVKGFPIEKKTLLDIMRKVGSSVF